MTHLLESAFAAAAKLPEAEQDALARALLAELESEATIDALIESSPEALAKLAARAPVDPERPPRRRKRALRPP